MSTPALGFVHGELRGALRRGLDAAGRTRAPEAVTPFPTGEPLDGRVVVLSPHLDDGVFSVGAAISAAAATGVHVDVVTVLAGDPAAADPSGPWDRARGFATAGEAAVRRREEDRRACELVGATPVWLPFCDHQYPTRVPDEEVWAAVGEAIGDAPTVLVPGPPLAHEDHLWLTRGVLERGLSRDARLGLYLEQPYALWAGDRADMPDALAGLLQHPLSWSRLSAGRAHRWRKARASDAYDSQLSGLSPTLIHEVVKYEARRKGEAVAWVA